MKYIRWVESHLFATADEKTPKHVEEKCAEYIVEHESKAHVRDSFLPIASAFSSANFAEPCVQPVAKEDESQSNIPLMSRPRPIAHNGTEKSFFSRGTIPTENINLPTRIHSKYRPSYSKSEETPENQPEEKTTVQKVPGRQDLLEIIKELYPCMIKYIDIRDGSQPKYSTCSTKGSYDTLRKQTLTMNTIPAYANLPTPPMSPFESLGRHTAYEINPIKTSDSIEEPEFHQIRSFLIKFIDRKVNNIPEDLKLRIMECYSISSADFTPETATNLEEHTGNFEKCIRTLIKVFNSPIAEKWFEIVEAEELEENNAKVEQSSTTLLGKNTERFAKSITDGYCSDSDLVRCRTKFAKIDSPTMFSMTNFTSTKKLSSFNLKKTYEKKFRTDRNSIRRAVSGVLG
ncbi:hypothetical protein HI914_01109 [Erysiphe necator]|uniref:Uncharacterized protein n=1 Tax=Uncinula necator TaxID=52586 RepID=A0A0B1P039_UNCNE|nr:hypothetical protein HI914_01109 [Erysiphe necator]KHJ30261.1 hypothetical protein EV44_g5994 [Erysiphe necator]